MAELKRLGALAARHGKEGKGRRFDPDRFTEAVAAAREAAARGEEEAAWEKYGVALSLWRGDHPADGPGSPLPADRATELMRLRTQAQREWCDLGLRLGRPRKVLGVLRVLAEKNRLDEPVHEKLMLALCQAGRHAEALAVYYSLRDQLTGQSGAAPGPALRELYQRIRYPERGTRP